MHMVMYGYQHHQTVNVHEDDYHYYCHCHHLYLASGRLMMNGDDHPIVDFEL